MSMVLGILAAVPIALFLTLACHERRALDKKAAEGLESKVRGNA